MKLIAIMMLLVAAPLYAEVDKANLPPPPVTAEQREALIKEFRAEERPKLEKEVRAELEKKYRAELEARLEQERKSYEGSLTNLWTSNAAVWGLLGLFIIWQTISAKKQAGELAKLKAAREAKGQ